MVRKPISHLSSLLTFHFLLSTNLAVAEAPRAAPPATLEQFGRATAIATLAAEYGLDEFSLRVVREALRPGPPIAAALGAGGAESEPGAESAVYAAVERRLSEFDDLWRRQDLWPRQDLSMQQGAPADRVFETLAEVVLPDSRPAEIFIYPRPFLGNGNPRSVGRLLARWAVDADRVDELKRRIEARQTQPPAQLAARVLLTQLAAAARDSEGVAEGLAWLEERLKTDDSANGAELACHAVPDLKFAEQSSSALSLLEAAAKAWAKQVELGEDTKDYGQLLLALARVRFKQGDADAGRKRLEEFLVLSERQNSSYEEDYGVYRRKLQLRQVVVELTEAGELVAALDALGQFADTPRTQGEPRLGDAIARLARLLKARPAGERYSLLKQWTLPAEGRRLVRVVAGFAPGESLSEPTEAAAMPPSDVVSSLALLLEAAGEAGRLDELAAEARAAAEERGIENAEALRLLVDVARGQGPAVELLLRKLAEDRRQTLPAQDDRSPPIAWADYLLARACMADGSLRSPPQEKLRSPPQETLRPIGQVLARTLITHGARIQDHHFLSHCRSDLWASQAAAEPDARLIRGQDPGLFFWRPASHQTAATFRAGATPAWWVAHEGHIAHVAGPAYEFLYFAYPLAGEFEFSVDAYEGGFGEGNISYGGLVFETLHLGSNTQIWPVGHHDSLALPDPVETPGAFNRLTIRVEPGRNRCYCNGHLVFEDNDPSPTSPWLALFSNRYMQTAFRNFAWQGEARIPREVQLTDGDRMEGWITAYYGETQPPRRWVSSGGLRGVSSGGLRWASSGRLRGAYDWRAADGVLYGRQSGSRRPAPPESWLYYHRPLQSGDTIRFEFFYEPDRYEVCPTVGRLALVLSADGVRLHRLTDATDHPAGGMARDNLFDERAHRRGPEKLPLVAGEWNQAVLALAGDVLTLSLNGVEVYERPLEHSPPPETSADNERFFGLYHDKQRTAAMVRNVVLSGDWPQRLSADALADTTRHAGKPETGALSLRRRAALSRVKHALIGEELLSQSAGQIWLRSRRLAPAERYALLHVWVLPSADHPTIRRRGGFTPVDPAPPAADLWESNTHLGGKLVAPAIELVALAGQLGRLVALEKEVKGVGLTGDFERRSQLALLVLIALAWGDEPRAEAFLREMYSLLKQISPQAARIAEHLRWPELVAVSAAVEHPVLRPTVLALAELMVEQNNQWYIGRAWDRAVRHLRGQAIWMAHGDAQPAAGNTAPRQPFGSQPPLTQWRPVNLARAETRGCGWPSAHWRSDNGRIEHVPGHARDLAYFAVPLVGDFQVDAQLSSFGWREMELVYDAFRRVVRPNPDRLGRAYIGWPLADADLLPPLEPLGAWYDFRLVVGDGLSTAFVNGQKIHEQRLSAHPDPWLALFCEGNFDGSARNVRITGNPTVPEVLEMSAASDLSGWRADYYGEYLTGEALPENEPPENGPAWRKQGDEIVGAKRAGVSGRLRNPPETLRESLLQYHRPLLEDGELEYEFFHRPGRSAVYPALDRLALVLEGDAVRVHWLTDAQFDRTGLTPDNLAVEDENRRGPAALPLVPDEWNRVKLTLAGDELTLWLNGVEIYRRPLEPSNRRFFGLFHYADQTEARVRRLTYRGQWPKALPALEDQELAVDALLATQFDANSLPARFECDFGRLIDLNSLRQSSEVVDGFLYPGPDGVRIELPAGREKPNGDFEIEARFKSLAVEPPAAGVGFGSGIDLHLQFDATDDHVIMQRRVQADGRQVLECGHGRRDPDGEYRWHLWPNATDAMSGRLKFVRKGAVVYYLFAEGDDGEFVLFDERTTGKGDVKFCQVLARAFDWQSAVDVVLEQLSVRAEGLPGR